MDRRRFIQAAGAGAAGLFAGCNTDEPTETDPGVTGTATEGTPTLRVGTYGSFVDAPSTSPGAWVKERFESEYDVNLQWFAPDGQMNYFLQRRQQNVTIDTDLYLGLTPENLVHADTTTGDGDSLFTGVDASTLSNADSIVDDYRFDPQDRAVPFGAAYISLVYNQNTFDDWGVPAPETFEDLTTDDYEDGLLVPNPQNSETGLEFLFWTVDQFGEDGYLDYWQRLTDNGTQIIQDWGSAYAAYSDGEAPMVVSYSTDQVFADQSGADMAEHQIGFPNDQGYAYLEAMAPFAGTDKMEQVEQFMDFMLQPDIQAEVAQRNVALPAVDNATLPSEFDELVHEPEEIVSFSYDELVGNVQPWLDDWSKQIAGK